MPLVSKTLSVAPPPPVTTLANAPRAAGAEAGADYNIRTITSLRLYLLDHNETKALANQ